MPRYEHHVLMINFNLQHCRPTTLRLQSTRVSSTLDTHTHTHTHTQIDREREREREREVLLTLLRLRELLYCGAVVRNIGTSFISTFHSTLVSSCSYRQLLQYALTTQLECMSPCSAHTSAELVAGGINPKTYSSDALPPRIWSF